MKKISKDLSSLFWTQFFGALNDNLFKNALVILITYQGITLFGLSSASLVALCGGLFILPFFILSALSGALADQWDKSALVQIIKKAEVIIALLAILGFLIKSYFMLLLVLFFFGVHSTFFGPLKYALIPDYSKKDQLVFANALISSGTFVAILLGTLLGGLLSGSQSALYGLYFLLVGFALSGLYFSLRLKRSDKSWEGLQLNLNPVSSSLEILKLVFKNPMVGLLCLGLSWFWFLGAGLLSIVPLLSKNIFYGNEQVATLLLFTFTLGMGIGPFVLEKLTRGKVVRSLIPLSLIVMTFFIFDMALLITKAGEQTAFLQVSTRLSGALGIGAFFHLKMSWRLIIDLFFLAFFGGTFTVPQFAELQRISATHELSRIVAGNNILNALAMVLVSVLLMIFFQMQLGLSLILGIIGFLNIIISVVLIFFYRHEFNKFWRF